MEARRGVEKSGTQLLNVHLVYRSLGLSRRVRRTCWGLGAGIWCRFLGKVGRRNELPDVDCQTIRTSFRIRQAAVASRLLLNSEACVRLRRYEIAFLLPERLPHGHLQQYSWGYIVLQQDFLLNVEDISDVSESMPPWPRNQLSNLAIK